MDIIKISDAEYEIMEIIWGADGEVTTADIIEKLGEDNFWKHTTILTLAKRLVDKNVLKVRKEKRVNYYSLKLARMNINLIKPMALSRICDGSIKSLVVSLYDNKKESMKRI